MLLKKDADDPDHKYLTEVHQATGRAADLVRRMLTFSRKMEVKLEAADINVIIESSLKLLQRAIPKMVSIKTVLAPDLDRVEADTTQLEQVLMNLATNAADAMEDSGQLTIATRNFTATERHVDDVLELETGNYVVIKVSDTGMGMDTQTQQRIFEPFFTTKEIGKGTGLGLATAYGIIQEHGGHIACYSELGVGTTFKIFLPTLPQDEQEESHGDALATPLEGSEHILLVDDEQTVLDIAANILERLGYTVTKTQRAEEALRVYADAQGTFDLVVLDLGMPGIGGEICSQKLLELNPKIHIIVASGYTGHKFAKDPEQYGLAGFLAKPYRLENLARTVRSVLDKKKQ